MRTYSHIASWVFLPLLMPLYGILIAMYVPNMAGLTKDSLYILNDPIKKIILTQFISIGCLAPALFFGMLFRFGVISTIEMEDKNQRKIPLLIMLACCLLLYAVFVLIAPDNVLPKFVYGLPLSGAFVTGIYLIITRWMKISLHAGGAGILTGFIIAYAYNMVLFPFWPILLSVLASGLVITARLYLKRHTPREVYFGWSLAVIITFITNQVVPFIV